MNVIDIGRVFLKHGPWIMLLERGSAIGMNGLGGRHTYIRSSKWIKSTNVAYYQNNG